MSLGRWIGLIAFIIALYVLWQIRDVLLLIFAAIVLAHALNILVEKFRCTGLRRGFAVLLSIVLLLLVLVGFYFLIVPPFADQFQQLIRLVPKGIAQFNKWVNEFKDNISLELLDRYIPDVNQIVAQLQPIANRLLGGGFTFFSSSLGSLAKFLLVIVLTLMLLSNPSAYQKSFIRLFPSFYRRRAEEILQECEVALRGWLVGILFNMFVISALSFVGLLVLRIRLPLAQSALAGILTFIPNIGPALSVIPPIAIALLDAPWKAIAVLILYIVIQQVESNLLTPIVMAQQVSLLPAVTLLAQVFFATFFGFLGLLLALPLTVVGQVWIKEVIIKDILDQWHHPYEKHDELAIASDSPEPTASSEEAKEVTPENRMPPDRTITTQEKPIADELN
jgi:predicted PurR-regulated permease PerM